MSEKTFESNHSTVELCLLDRKFKIKIPGGKERELELAAQHLNHQLLLLQTQHPFAPPEKLMALTALNLTRDFLFRQQNNVTASCTLTPDELAKPETNAEDPERLDTLIQKIELALANSIQKR